MRNLLQRKNSQDEMLARDKHSSLFWFCQWWRIFLRLSPGVNVIKLFFFVANDKPNKLECLHLAKTFQSSLTLLVTPGAYPRRKHPRGTSIGLALALPSNSKTWLEIASKEKYSSLLGLVISDEGKMLYNIDTRSPEQSCVGLQGQCVSSPKCE